MEKQRVEAFSDGMFTIIMTIMVLELKVPEDKSPAALLHHWPVYLAYALSFGNVFTFWLNHRHLFAALEHVDTRLLWSNAVLLFVLSWVPFATAYAGESRWLAPLPVMFYGATMVLGALALHAVRKAALRQLPDDAAFRIVLSREIRSGLLLALAFAIAAAISWFVPLLGLLLYIAIPTVRIATGAPYRAAVGVQATEQ
jgi:uncharacterized membrane protein